MSLQCVLIKQHWENEKENEQNIDFKDSSFCEQWTGNNIKSFYKLSKIASTQMSPMFGQPYLSSFSQIVGKLRKLPEAIFSL